jgi:hypothetical protein
MVTDISDNAQKGFDFEKLKADLIQQLSFLTEEFKAIVGNPPSCYLAFDHKELALCVHNAVGDIRRSTEHHSNKKSENFGPSDVKIAGFLSKWVAKHKFIHVQQNMPVNLNSTKIEMVNSKFAVFVAEAFLTGNRISNDLIKDLRYCFEFRDLSGDMLTLLLNHAVILPNKNKA